MSDMGEDGFSSQYVKQIEQCLAYKSLRKGKFYHPLIIFK